MPPAFHTGLADFPTANDNLARELTSLAGQPDYDDAGAEILTVQKITKHVSRETCRTRWRGEAMDYDMAVSG